MRTLIERTDRMADFREHALTAIADRDEAFRAAARYKAERDDARAQCRNLIALDERQGREIVQLRREVEAARATAQANLR